MKRIYFLPFFIVLYFYIWAFYVSALIWEDLWLDIYKALDEGVKNLEQTQYEYELSGQWEGSVFETVNQILEREWLECNVYSADDIETLLWNDWGNAIEAITSACAWWESRVSIQFSEKVQNAFREIRRVFTQRAERKAEMTYRVARIGLYADGNTENSPFDLVMDLQEIDRIIFWEEIDYEWITPVDNQSFQDFINKVINNPIEEDMASEEDVWWEGEENISSEEDLGETMTETDVALIPEHLYTCPVPNTTWLDDEEYEALVGSLNPEWTWSYIPIINTFLYPEWIRDDWGDWKWPLSSEGPSGSFSSAKAPWACNEFFCIIIEFETTEYGLIGWETRSIMKILSKVAEHCEKPANASLTQRKQTTNNFELGSIIRDLPGMLRWLGIEVSTKSIPILEETEQDEDPTREEIRQEVENMLRERFRWIWLDYERQNDIDIADRSAIVQKIFQTSWGMPLSYPEQRLNDFRSYDQAFTRASLQTQSDTTQITSQQQLEWFVNHFNELERFTFSLSDFIEQFSWVITTLENIPTRSP